MTLRINKNLQTSVLAQKFKSQNRIHIANFFQQQDAYKLSDYVKAISEWNLSLNSAEKHFDVTHEHRKSVQPDFYQQLTASVGRDAIEGFQYFFENYAVYDAYYNNKCPEPLARMFEFLNSEPFIACMREITGLNNIQFADAQLTKYAKGHFLTEHDDNVAGKNRLVAYVLNLSPVWRAEWGGLLMFHDHNNHIEQAFTPAFNSLNLFAVPQRHSVSQVASYVTASRYSVTGWLRAGSDPRK